MLTQLQHLKQPLKKNRKHNNDFFDLHQAGGLPLKKRPFHQLSNSVHAQSASKRKTLANQSDMRIIRHSQMRARSSAG